MLPYPEIDPVAFSIGPLSVHWYGIAYLLSFLGVWRIAVWQTQRPWSPIKKGQVEDLIFYGAMGVVLGGRFGYVFSINFLVSWMSLYGYSKFGKGECRFMVDCWV